LADKVRSMRIAIVCATYHRGKSYQENVWAEQLAKSGHAVRMFAAGESDSNVEHIAETSGAYQLQHAATWRLPRGMFWSRRVHQLVREFQPDLIVVCSDKAFASGVVHDEQLRHVPLISTYSENLSMHEFDWRKRGVSLKQRALALGFVAMRGGPIRAACRRSAVVVGNTPQARQIISRLFSSEEWREISGKMIDMPLGFSPDHFFCDAALRRRVRADLGLEAGDVVVAATSHFAPVKEPFIRQIVSAIQRLAPHHARVRGLIVGFSQKPEHAAVSARVTEQIDGGDSAARFIKHPFAQRQRLNELYNAADIAIFGRASISCQEALGTGLIGCFVDDGSLNHLVTMPDQGVFFRSNDENDLAAKLEQAVRKLENMDVLQRDTFRQRLAEESRWLGYDRIIAGILDEVSRRTGLTRTAGAVSAV
jgi:hypothetical protein